MTRTHAVVMHELGDESVLQLESVDLPAPGRDEVTLRVLACAVNHLDLELRDGRSRMPLAFPHVLGRELVGEVVETGADVGSWTVGDRVVVLPNAPCGRCERCTSGAANLCAAGWMPGIHGWGGYAEHVVVPVRALVAAPDLDPVQTVGLPISFGTAWRAMHEVAEVRTGEWVLVPGAGGGLGHASVQVAAAAGARVIGLVRSEDKAAFVRECGAEEVVVGESDWTDRVRELTGGHGVDVVVEHIGGASFERAVRAMATRGRLVVAGGHGGEHPSLDVIEVFRRELRLLGLRSQRPHDVATVLALGERGVLRAHVDRVLPLADAQEAHRLVAGRGVHGKVVLVP